MMPAKICLVLAENTLEKDLQLLDKYRSYIDIAELRADCLLPQELLYIRDFPHLAHIPVILTIRRILDGGTFCGGEGTRITLFARGLAFAEQESLHNFAYIDLESDLHVPSLEAAAQAFNIRIIRSLHNLKGDLPDISKTAAQIRRTDHEIVKIAYQAHNLDDVSRLFTEAPQCSGEHTLIAMGRYGIPSRILASRLGSSIVYTMAPEYTKLHNIEDSCIDPVTLHTLYRFKSLDAHTRIYGVVGANTSKSMSPLIHNQGYRKKNINAVYIPLSAPHIEQAIRFAESAPLAGFSVTNPFKFRIRPFLHWTASEVDQCKAVNTVVCEQAMRRGFNTDIYGITKAIQALLKRSNLRFKRVAIIGTGGGAHAAAQAVYLLHGKACIFGRNTRKANTLASRYHFKWAPLDLSTAATLKKYSTMIIQTTSIGTEEGEDPLPFYHFSGSEYVLDIIYTPEKTTLLQRAEKAGCKISNGYTMLCYQAQQQFELFTGEPYE